MKMFKLFNFRFEALCIMFAIHNLDRHDGHVPYPMFVDEKKDDQLFQQLLVSP